MQNGTSAFEELYQKGPILGRGASGVAFVVRPKKDPELQYVAKELCIVRADEKRRRDAFAESQLLRELSHKNIVRCIDVFQDDELMYIVMEYANGGDLSARIQARRSQNQFFAESTVMHVFVQICAALNYIHSRKIVHRDLKPPNVFVVGEGELQTCTVKLGDFGIAKMIESTCGQAHSTVGTPSYLSPEICKNTPYGMKSDIWSLGIILYELACLKVPFHAGNLPAMALMICTSEPTPLPEEFGSELPLLVKELLQKDPNKRPQVRVVLQRPYVNRLLPEDVRADILAYQSGGSSSSRARAAANASADGASAATESRDSTQVMPELSASSSSVGGGHGGGGGFGSARGGAGSRHSERPPPQPPPPPHPPDQRRGSSYPSSGHVRGVARNNSSSTADSGGGARLPSCGPYTRSQRHDRAERMEKHDAEEPVNWAWRRPSDGERVSDVRASREAGIPGGKSRPAAPVGKEKDRDRARPRDAGGGERERAVDRGENPREDRSKKADRAAAAAAAPIASELRNGEGPRLSRSSNSEQQRRVDAAVERAAASLAAEQAGTRCSWSAADVGAQRGAGYSAVGGHSFNGSFSASSTYLLTSGDLRASASLSAPSSAPSGNGGAYTWQELEVVTLETSGLADPDEELYHQHGAFNNTNGTHLESIVSEVRPPADLLEPAPPFADPPSSSGSITSLLSGTAGDFKPSMRTRIRRHRGRPPLLAGQEAVDSTGDVRSPARQRPSARGLEAASSSPGDQQTLHSTAPISSAPLALSAAATTRSVSPATKAAALREEQTLPHVSMLRSSGSAPALPPLPPLVAPTRPTVPRSRSVVALQEPGRPYDSNGRGRGYVEPLQRETVPHLFRTAPLPISSDRSSVSDSAATASQDRQGPPPPSLAPPPSQPPPPPLQRQATRDDPASVVRLAQKLPNAVVGQSDTRLWREPAPRDGIREPPGAVGMPAEGWGDVDSRLASARLQSVV